MTVCHQVAGDEERCQPGLDIFGDFLGGAILGVPEGSGSGAKRW